MWRRMAMLAIGVLSTGCAAASSTSRPVKSAGREVITAAEIVAARVSDVYQAVVQLRPEFLRRRTATAIPMYGAPQVVIYVDDLILGSAESMRLIPLAQVRLIRYFGPMDADLRWGKSHPAGAIHVVTIK